MNQGLSKSGRSMPTEAETEAVMKYGASLIRLVNIAKRAGASAEDIGRARMWPLLWGLEVARRHELEPLAEVGRKVSGGRPADDEALLERDFAVTACACRLLAAGAKGRGLAGKVRKELNSKITVRTINRILDRWMPLVLSDFK